MLHPIRFTAAALTVGAVIFAGAGVASATNASTAVSSTCPDGRWTVAMSVTSQFDGTIHVTLDDAHGPTPLMALGPFATKTITEHPDAGWDSWSWRWSTPDGILNGDAISGTVTRPADCGQTPPTSTPPTTTCAGAIPPRADCGATTVPPATTVPATPTSPAETTTVPPPVVNTADTPTAVQRPTPTTHPTELPTTGSSSAPVILAGFGLGLAGIALVTVTRRGAS